MFSTQSERDNVELPLLPYHACSQVEQSQFESIAPIPVFEMFPFLRYWGKYSWQKNDPISIIHSIGSYFISTRIHSIPYIYNSRTISPSHVWSKLSQSPLLYNPIHNSYTVSIPHQYLLRKSWFSINGWGYKSFISFPTTIFIHLEPLDLIDTSIIAWIKVDCVIYLQSFEH